MAMSKDLAGIEMYTRTTMAPPKYAVIVSSARLGTRAARYYFRAAFGLTSFSAVCVSEKRATFT